MPKIVKRIIIKDKLELYKLLQSKDELLSNNNFAIFLDYMNDYIYGCNCEKSHYDNLSTIEYNNLKNEIIFQLLKDYFNCDEVEII